MGQRAAETKRTTRGLTTGGAALAFAAAATVLGAGAGPGAAAGAATGGAAAAAKSPAAQIAANWKAFFGGKTSAAKKVTLLQDGTKFKSVITSQMKTFSTVSATVSKVTDVKKATAKVRYTILLGGSPVLKNQTGTAVRQGGTWRVGDGSFCALLAMDQVKTKACPKGT